MPFLIDEFAPKSYEETFFHRSIYERLKLMSTDNSIPHVIFHGAPGAGKKTMIEIFLKMIYDESIAKLYTTTHNIAGSGNKKKDEYVQNSAHHIIINPTNTNFDRYLVHEIVKKYAGSKTLELTQDPNGKFKTIQISNLDRLSHSAQTSLRRMIEVNASICRFIMWCDNLSNVIGPLKSRCVCIRVPRPEPGEMFAYLSHLTVKKDVNVNPYTLCDIIKYSECNIKTALWCLQLTMLGYDYKTNYVTAVDNMIKLIMTHDTKNIEEIRDIFFNIWITNYEGVKIVRDILRRLLTLDTLSDKAKANIIIKTSEIEYNILRGRRVIIHFDQFVLNVMKTISNDNPQTNKKIKIKRSEC